MKAKYPYENLSLKNIKDERWEDIPGLDGYFVGSNFGRIKRLEYEMQYKNGAIYKKPEKIIKPSIVKQPNKFVGDSTSFLTARVTLSGKRYNYTVARLVYHCFVEPIDLADHTKFILAKDCDNFNIIPSNLMIASLGQKSTRAFQRNRSRSPLLDLSAQFKNKIRKMIIETKSKQVTQYTKSGRRIKTYPSAAAAEQATGIHASAIGNIANGNNRKAGGFFWRWGNEKRIDVKSFIEVRKKERRKKNSITKVTQYDMEGNRIAQYPSLTDAQEATGTNDGAIRLVTQGVYKSAKGFFWKKGYGKEKIDLSGHKWGKASMAATQSKKVDQYTSAGEYLRTFTSVKEAARFLEVKAATVSGACTGMQKTCRGYTLRFG